MCLTWIPLEKFLAICELYNPPSPSHIHTYYIGIIVVQIWNTLEMRETVNILTVWHMRERERARERVRERESYFVLSCTVSTPGRTCSCLEATQLFPPSTLCSTLRPGNSTPTFNVSASKLRRNDKYACPVKIHQLWIWNPLGLHRTDIFSHSSNDHTFRFMMCYPLHVTKRPHINLVETGLL